MSPPPAPGPDPEADLALVQRCRDGDAAAWRLLVRRYQRLVYAVVTRTGLDEHAAADVFQTVFQRLVQHLPRLQQPERLQAWIVTTAKREALLALRLGRRTVSMTRDDDEPAFDVADEAPLADEQLSALQQQHRLREALERLDGRCRELLGLLFRDEDDKLPYDEIGQRLGMPVGSIGPTRSRCLGKLRSLVDES